MIDACRITRPGEGRGPWNDEIDDYDPAPRVTAYEGKCQVQERDTQENATIAGEADLDTQRYTVKLPVATSTGVRKDDEVEITFAALDPDLLGRKFTVGALHHKTYATARRLPCVEVV